MTFFFSDEYNQSSIKKCPGQMFQAK